MKRLFIPLATVLLCTSAAAQVPSPQPQDSDITKIIRDILGETQLPFPATPGTNPAQSAGIDNIPVTIEVAEGALFEGEWLVVSAFAPPRPNGPQSNGERLGETRLLLRGLIPPFNIVVAAPTEVTAQLEFAQVRAQIEDTNGNAVLTSSQDGFYRGTQPAMLTLAPKPLRLGVDLPPETIVRFEQTRGKVEITKPNELFRGAILSVQLTETGLVGGNQSAIKGETRIQIDGEKPPFDFTLDYGVPENGLNMPLVLSASITDWAGRKTHVMAKPLDFNGPDYDYRLKLDAFKQGRDVANFEFTEPKDAARTDIKGQAIFNAYKGLPSGSYLKIRLRSPLGPNNQPRELSTTAVSLDGLSGNVDFIASAPSINFDPELPAPLIDLAIMNPSGNAIFESGSLAVNPSTINLITLTPRPFY